MTSITSRVETLTRKATSLRGQLHAANGKHDTLTTRLAGGDEKVTAESLILAEREVERLSVLSDAVNAQLSEARFLAGNVGPDQGPYGLTQVVADILSPLGTVKIVTPDDDIDGADLYVSQLRPSLSRVQFPDGLVRGEVVVFGRSLSQRDVASRIAQIRNQLGERFNQSFHWDVASAINRSNVGWAAIRLVGANVYPDVPSAAEVNTIGNPDALSSLAENIRAVVGASFSVNDSGSGWSGSGPVYIPSGSRTPIRGSLLGATFTEDSVIGSTRTIVATFDIEAWRHQGHLGSDRDVDQAIYRAAAGMENAVLCVGRVTDIVSEKVRRGKEGQVYRITVTGISHVPESATDADQDAA